MALLFNAQGAWAPSLKRAALPAELRTERTNSSTSAIGCAIGGADGRATPDGRTPERLSGKMWACFLGSPPSH